MPKLVTLTRLESGGSSIEPSNNNLVLDIDPVLLAYARSHANKPYNPNEPMLTPAQRELIEKAKRMR